MRLAIALVAALMLLLVGAMDASDVYAAGTANGSDVQSAAVCELIEPPGSVLAATPPACTSVYVWKENQKIYDRVSAQAGTGIAADAKVALESCFKQTQAHMLACNDEQGRELADCLGFYESAAKTPQAAVHIAGGIRMANCYEKIGRCFNAGPGSDIWMIKDDQGACSGSGSSKAILDAYYGRFLKLRQSQFVCWHEAAKAAEAAARNLLARDRCDGTNSASLPTIECLNEDIGNRVCKYQASGGQFSEVRMVSGGAEPSDLAGTNPVDFAGRKACSGSLLGDGQTIVTVGHCLDTSSPSSTPVTIFDRDGRGQVVTANCAAGEFVAGTAREFGAEELDLGICMLSTPIGRVSPVYLATYDASVNGSECQPDSLNKYVIECGGRFFEELSHLKMRATMLAFAFEVSQPLKLGKAWTAKTVLIKSVGTLTWLGADNSMDADTLCTGGCSGAGLAVGYRGETTVVALYDIGNRYYPDFNRAVYIRSDDFDRQFGAAYFDPWRVARPDALDSARSAAPASVSPGSSP